MEAAKLEVVKPKRSLVAKLAEVMGAIEHIAKRGRNTFHNYDYATEADIVAAVRKEMAARSVLLVPSLEGIEWKELQRKNGVERLCTLRMLFTFMDGDSEQTLAIHWIGEGADSGDKAVYKAMTGAEKYVLLKTFLIPTGDDPEADATQSRPRPVEAKKADPKTAPATDPAASALRARAVRLWKAAEAKKWPLEQFQAFASKLLGHKKQSTEWTEAEIGQLEAALPAELHG